MTTLFKLKTSRDYDDSYADEENVGIIENSEIQLADSIVDFDAATRRATYIEDDNATPTQENFPGLCELAMKKMVEETSRRTDDKSLSSGKMNDGGGVPAGYRKLDDEGDTGRLLS